MKLFINQDGKVQGPFPEADLRQKIYSGEISRTVPVCVEGANDWQSLDAFLARQTEAQSLPSQPTNPGLTASALDNLHDPKEKTALLWLYIFAVPVSLGLVALLVTSMGVALIIVALWWLIVAIIEMLFVAHLKTNAVRVSESQLPALQQAIEKSCQKLGMKAPEVYILQQNVWNAFATKIFGRRMVVLLSGAVDSILLKGDEQQLAWLIGHELGHHWAGHLDLKHKFAKLGGVIIWLGLWHSRRAELTCDRVGLYCAGSLKSSRLALMNATVGAQLANRVNPEAAVAQWQEHRGEFFVRYRTLYSTHPHLLARLDHLNQAAAELGIAN